MSYQPYPRVAAFTTAQRQDAARRYRPGQEAAGILSEEVAALATSLVTSNDGLLDLQSLVHEQALLLSTVLRRLDALEPHAALAPTGYSAGALRLPYGASAPTGALAPTGIRPVPEPAASTALTLYGAGYGASAPSPPAEPALSADYLAGLIRGLDQSRR